MRRAVFFAAALASATGCKTTSVHETTPPEPTPPEIQTQTMLDTVVALSNDSMMGRHSRNAVAIQTAAAWLAEQHRQIGTQPVGEDYRVNFELQVSVTLGDEHHFWIDVDGESDEVGMGAFVSLAMGRSRTGLGEAVFVGHGRPHELKLSLRRKMAVVLLEGEAPEPAEMREFIDRLAKRGASGVVFVMGPGRALPAPSHSWEALDSLSIPVVATRFETAELLPLEEPLEDLAASLAAEPERSRSHVLPKALISLAPIQVKVTEPVPNVVAYIPGTDLKHEVVMVGGHYDHIGTEAHGVSCRDPDEGERPGDEICNGADDNASGTAVVLELARALMDAGVKPRRTIVFAHFAGEELGLHGSRALATDPPEQAPFREGKVVAMINLDMVGRYREDPGLTVFAVSTSPAWLPLLRSIDPRGLVIHYEPTISARSDHANFHRQGIPVLFFFTGLHDDYHRTSDEIDRVNLAGMSAVAKIVLDTVVELASGAPIPFREAEPSDLENRPLPGSE